ncbi:hypothetical protein RHRU231_420165 [Rhodococcus ruber]|uniref:Uncharacterized protein n=1 Tax=Rhodococcus ruber TaxID=1830 RepID=A0A098BLN0_9NOCA|nr:hypothetical protein RHRU231_420165 [Rhodococcus ruber]
MDPTLGAKGRPVTRCGRSDDLDEGVHAVLVVDLPAGDRRVEHAEHAHPGVGLDPVPLVAVEQVHRAGRERVHGAGLEVGERAGALDEPHGLDVVGVVELVDGAGLDRGLVERETDLVAAEHDALAAPVAVVRRDVAVGAGDFFGGTDDHGQVLPVLVFACGVRRWPGLRPGPPRWPRTGCSGRARARRR